MLSGDQFFSAWIEQPGDQHIIIRTRVQYTYHYTMAIQCIHENGIYNMNVVYDLLIYSLEYLSNKMHKKQLKNAR